MGPSPRVPRGPRANRARTLVLHHEGINCAVRVNLSFATALAFAKWWRGGGNAPRASFRKDYSG